MHDLIIIGAGPAGLTSAIYAGRARLKTLVLEKLGVGGQISLTETIENFPGFPEGINSFDLIEKFKKQAQVFGVEIKMEEALELDIKEKIKSIKTQEQVYQTKSLILATGAQPKKLDIPGEKEFSNKGVSYCATCDGPFFKNKEIVVVGGGDAALEEALYLTRFAKKVIILHRRDKLRAAKILEERAKENPKIEFVLESIPLEILGQNSVTGIKIKNVKNNQEFILNCEGIFIFIGFKPNTDFLKNIVKLDEEGYIITDENLTTSKDGIFACGDCRRRPFKQIVTACSEGALALHSVVKYLEEK